MFFRHLRKVRLLNYTKRSVSSFQTHVVKTPPICNSVAAIGDKPLRIFSIEEVKQCKSSQILKSDRDPLCIAIELGENNITNLLLAEGHDPSINNNAAVKLAASVGNYQLIKMLSQDSRVDITSDNFYALRLSAIKENEETIKDNEEIVDFLLSINPPTNNNYMLLWAANYGKVKIFKHYLNQNKTNLEFFGRDIIYDLLTSYSYFKDRSKEFMYCWDTDTETTEMLKLLVEDRRFKFDQPFKCGAYPLELLVWGNQLEAVNIILSTFTEKPHYYDNCIKSAAYYGYFDMVDLLLNRSDADPNPAFEAVYILSYLNRSRYSGIKYRKLSEKLISDSRFSITANNNSFYNRVSVEYPEIADILLRYPIIRNCKNSQDDDLNQEKIKEFLMILISQYPIVYAPNRPKL